MILSHLIRHKYLEIYNNDASVTHNAWPALHSRDFAIQIHESLIDTITHSVMHVKRQLTFGWLLEARPQIVCRIDNESGRRERFATVVFSRDFYCSRIIISRFPNLQCVHEAIKANLITCTLQWWEAIKHWTLKHHKNNDQLYNFTSLDC